jgi:hypothetical protein
MDSYLGDNGVVQCCGVALRGASGNDDSKKLVVGN